MKSYETLLKNFYTLTQVANAAIGKKFFDIEGAKNLSDYEKELRNKISENI